ncbi:MAG TPA: response regulator [Rhizomicrobium sp.]|jgi:CheY-like chemotaxis protein
MPVRCPSVLVVDDDDTVREIARALLEAEGYEVHDATDGEAALAFLETRPVDIVLLDIMMPRKEGLETLVELKQRFPAITVIAMSASGMRRGHNFLAVAAKFGADGTLQKPFSPDELFGLLAACAGRSHPGLSAVLSAQKAV